MHLPTRVLEERAPTLVTSSAETTLPLDHPIHKKKPPIVDPLPVKRDEDLPLEHPIHRKKPPIVDPLPIKRDEPTAIVLPLEHPVHKKKPPIVDPLPIKRAVETHTSALPFDHPIRSKRPPIVDPLPVKRDVPTETVLPLDHPIHKKKPAIVDPVLVNPYPKREKYRDDFWKRDGRGGQAEETQTTQDAPAGKDGQINVDASSSPQTLIDGLPDCIRRCLFRAPIGACAADDFKCLCRNDIYLTSVMNCWTINCDGTEMQFAVNAAGTMCSTTLVTGPWPAESNILTAPVIYSKTAWNIQAVMSSICGFILLLAMVLGGLSCRAQARKEASHRSGTGGTKGSRDFVSQGSGTGKGSASNRASGGQQVTTFGFGEESIVTSLPRIPTGPRKVPRFTAVPSEEKEADEKDAADADSWDLSNSKHSHSRTHSRSHSRKGSKSSNMGSKDGHEERSLLPNPVDEGNASDTSDIGIRVLPYALSSPSSSSGGSHNATTIVIGPEATSGRRPDISPLESVGSVRTQGAESSTEDEPFARRGA